MIQAARSKPIKLSTPQTDQIDDMDESLPLATSKLALEVFMNTELGDHLKEFRNGTIIPNEFFNSTIPWQKSKEFAEKPLADFIPFSAPEKYSHSTQVSLIYSITSKIFSNMNILIGKKNLPRQIATSRKNGKFAMS
jgi:hypothetical protein